jgi:predicted metal-binding membrane protein
MMAAMMFASVSPTVALYSRMTRRRARLAPLVFTSGYLLTWSGAGLLAFGISVVAALITAEKTLPWSRTVTYGTAAILLLLGVWVVAAPDVIPGLNVPGDGSMN